MIYLVLFMFQTPEVLELSPKNCAILLSAKIQTCVGMHGVGTFFFGGGSSLCKIHRETSRVAR